MLRFILLLSVLFQFSHLLSSYLQLHALICFIDWCNFLFCFQVSYLLICTFVFRFVLLISAILLFGFVLLIFAYIHSVLIRPVS